MPRYRYDAKTQELIETNVQRKADRIKGDRSLWNDTHYDGAKTTGGHDISSRKKHRQYMKDNNLTTTTRTNGKPQQKNENATKQMAAQSQKMTFAKPSTS